MDAEAAPSQKTMQFLKTRNNISRRKLERQLDMIEREKTFNLMSITHDSLDLKEFLRKIKRCPSEDLPEARHWLGRRRAESARATTDEYGIPRDIATAPAEAQPTHDPVVTRQADDEPDRAHAYTEIQRGAPATAMHLSYMKLFGRRNAYADVAADATDSFSDVFAKTPSQAMSNGRRTGLSDYSDAVDTVVAENRRTQGSALSSAASGKRVNILVVGDNKTPGRRGRHNGVSPEPEDGDAEEGDWMKTLLTDTSRRRQRQRRRRRAPLPDRISEFYGKLDKLKKEENAPPTKEFHRRWILLTQGVEAALAESSDEEEEVLHTI